MAPIDQRRSTVNPACLEGACVEKQRRRSGVAWVHNGMASFESMRRQAVSEVQTKPAVHCTDPAAPTALPRHALKLNRSVPAGCWNSNTATNEYRGSVWSRCSVCWRVGLLQAFRRDCFASKGKSMCTVNAASVEPAGREEVSGVARLKPWSARALLKRELECCSARPEKANCQPGLFGRACLEKQRRRSDVVWFYNGMASFENGMFKGRGR